MAKCGLIGNPISHSKSPALFRAAYGEGPHTYSLIEAPTCQEAMQRFREEGFTGINITSPFKDEVMEYISLPDSISSTLGSANTIISRNGELHSYNTDYYGVRNTLEAFIPNPGCRALVIGAGGAGKAAALAVKDMGLDVYFANRSSHAAAPFAQKIGVEYVPLDKIPLLLPQTDIIVYKISMEIEPLLRPVLEGRSAGIISEAGLPGVADPGADVVAAAQRRGIEVVPLVGPSSLLMALMASGQNGQSFAFNGYLPIKPAERAKALRHFERRAQTEGQSQIFIEAPYRNEKLFSDMLSVLSGGTRLTVAVDITSPTQQIRTLTVEQWRHQPAPDMHKRPTIFIVGR